jgi:hypothetical protein
VRLPGLVARHRPEGEDTVICPQCQAENKRSTVTEGGTFRTLMAFPRRWDEHGALILNTRRNRSTTNYSCSNGHSWKVKS